MSAVKPASGNDSDELVYAPAILILSHDLYPRKLEVIREYIQNASDALDEFISIADVIDDHAEPQIKVSVQGRSVLIFDNGIGMDRHQMENLRRIAYSEKKEGQEAGYKGIGRLAGIAVADKLTISSTSYGDPKLHHFEFRAKEMRDEVSANKRQGLLEPASDVIRRHTELLSDDIDPKEHYTIVEIREVNHACEELLDPTVLKEYIGEIGPVDFSPNFSWGEKISERLRQTVPDYSPKTIYLATRGGERVRVYKPYGNEMMIAEPQILDIVDPANPNTVVACYWFATKGQQILDKVRPAGKIFTVDGNDPRGKKRLAGLVYKLFGFSIGDRTLPSRTLWETSFPRALWFTGEIHIVDKGVLPTTDRSDFQENAARKRLYKAAAVVPAKLNPLAQQISDDRKAFNDAEKFGRKFRLWKEKLETQQIERAEFRTIKKELHEELDVLRRRTDRSKDKEIQQFGRETARYGRTLDKALDDAKTATGKNGIADIASQLEMTSKAKKVYQIVMDTLSDHYAGEPDEYHEVAAKISTNLRKKY